MRGSLFKFPEGNNEDELSKEIEKSKVKTKFQEKHLDRQIKHLPIFLSSFDSPR